MKLTRRNALIGLGTVAAGAGVVGGSGAFTSVTAERTVSVETAGDADAALALAATGSNNASEYITTSEDDQIQLDLTGTSDGDASSDGLNQNAKTTINNLIEVTNNGSQDLSELRLNLIDDDSDTDYSSVFEFTTGEDGELTFSNDSDITDGDGLGLGNSITFGLIIDLLSGDIDSLPTSVNFTLEITANT